MITGIQ